MIIKALRGFAPALVFGIGGLLLWELALFIIQPEGFVLPAPSAILIAFFDDFQEILTASKNTGFIVVTGLVGGVALGVAT